MYTVLEKYWEIILIYKSELQIWPLFTTGRAVKLHFVNQRMELNCPTCGKEMPNFNIRFCSLLEIKIKIFHLPQMCLRHLFVERLICNVPLASVAGGHLEQCAFGIFCITDQAADSVPSATCQLAALRSISLRSTSGVNINFLIEWGQDSNLRRYRRADTKSATLTTRPRLLTILRTQI